MTDLELLDKIKQTLTQKGNTNDMSVRYIDNEGHFRTVNTCDFYMTYDNDVCTITITLLDFREITFAGEIPEDEVKRLDEAICCGLPLYIPSGMQGVSVLSREEAEAEHKRSKTRPINGAW